MGEMELQETDKNLRDLVTEYQDKQDGVVDMKVEMMLAMDSISILLFFFYFVDMQS